MPPSRAIPRGVTPSWRVGGQQQRQQQQPIEAQTGFPAVPGGWTGVEAASM